mmetsp:Transcript_165717/g.402724  ORF Transcript_165717/g.402724 Transcript_165717/m.402724 type:complete len:457 (+) Transcript_165717:429-1799(+)
MAAAAKSPALHRRVAAGGYYADPASPIASTPQRRRPGAKVRTSFAADEAPDPSELSPMKPPRAARRRTGEARTAATEAYGFSAGAGGGAGGANGGYGIAAGAAGEEDGGIWGTETALFSPDLKWGTEESKAKEAALTPGSSTGSSSGASPDRTPASVTPPSARHAPSHTPAAGGAIAQCSLASPTHYARKRHAEDDLEDEYDGGVSVQRELAAISTPESGRSEADSDMGAGGDGGDEYDEFEEFNPYLFIKCLPRYEEVVRSKRPLVLPRKPRTAPRLSLVLDLDETLVHCSVEPIEDADLTFPVEFNGQTYEVFVRKRPYLDHFLEWCASKYEVTVFTASQQVYAEKLLDLLDPRGRLVKYRLFRDSCLNVDGNFLKDLSVLGRDLHSTVLVDNSPHAFGYQVDNGIPIESWFDDPTDTELLKLANFLPQLDAARDVRPIVRSKFQLHKLIAQAS